MKGIRLTVPEVAPVLGISEGELRKLLRQNRVPYGTAIVTGHKADGTPKFRYDIWLPKLLEHTGLEEWPERRTSSGKSSMAANSE